MVFIYAAPQCFLHTLDVGRTEKPLPANYIACYRATEGSTPSPASLAQSVSSEGAACVCGRMGLLATCHRQQVYGTSVVEQLNTDFSP